ncbi:MAG TPA: NAD-dependent epimerase/dehydratase family protein [Solirubrobacteraceae bacterium]
MPQAKKSAAEGLTVAVTGPTGDIGKALVSALERSPKVKRIIGMARRPFDPSGQGWRKTEYRRGDVLKRKSVDDLVRQADVVVHLAFIIFGSPEETREVNLKGTRNVFEAAIAARKVKRLVYASSVAAYGFDDDGTRPDVFTEDVPPHGTESFYYSAQKAELEALLAELLKGKRRPQAYVFRPCIVAGPGSLILFENIPRLSIGDVLPSVVRDVFDFMPILKPVIPDPGVPFQLVHEDDVATAMRAAVLGKGEPGVYNLAADGQLTMADVADAIGGHAVAIPDLAISATAELAARLPFLPPEAKWLQSFRRPTIMSTAKAKKELGWKPEHNARQTLRQTVAAARDASLLR